MFIVNCEVVDAGNAAVNNKYGTPALSELTFWVIKSTSLKGKYSDIRGNILKGSPSHSPRRDSDYNHCFINLFNINLVLPKAETKSLL